MLSEVDKFLHRQSQERSSLAETIHREEQKQLHFAKPELCPDFEQLLEDNLAQVVNSNEDYNRIQQVNLAKKHREEVQQHAKEMTEDIQGMAEKQRLKALSEIKQLKKAEIAQVFAGNKTEELVLRFIGNLKQGIQAKRAQVIQQSNEQFIEKIVKKQRFNKQLKQVRMDKVSIK